MSEIVVGQNAALPPGPVAVSARGAVALGSLFGLAVLPEGGNGWLSLQDREPCWLSGRDAQTVDIDPVGLPPGTERVYLGIYARRSAATIRQFLPARFEVGGHGFSVLADDIGATFLAFAELYLRNGTWKVRARADWSVAGVAAFAGTHRSSVDVELEEEPLPDPTDELRGRDPMGAWSGSAFLIGPGVAVTNAHVVDGAARISAVGDAGRFNVAAIVSDEGADIALVRIRGIGSPTPLSFRAGFDLSAGEQVFAVGFPMSGFLGAGPQITSGMVANCLGPGNDTRLLQITTPIQPGSSGGPVFDASGRLVGVAVASLTGAQNVNFAVRAALVSYLAQSVGIDVSAVGGDAPVSPDRILRACRGSIFKLECHS